MKFLSNIGKGILGKNILAGAAYALGYFVVIKCATMITDKIAEKKKLANNIEGKVVEVETEDTEVEMI